MLGMSLTTTIEEIYRTIIESTAFGTRKILEAYLNNGIAVDEIYACGGLARNSKEVMQVFADVLGRQIKAVMKKQTPAFGSAMYAAVAAGQAQGGFDTIEEAIQGVGRQNYTIYVPDRNNQEVYDRLYREYGKLYDYFGLHCDVMKSLRAIKEDCLAKQDPDPR